MAIDLWLAPIGRQLDLKCAAEQNDSCNRVGQLPDRQETRLKRFGDPGGYRYSRNKQQYDCGDCYHPPSSPLAPRPKQYNTNTKCGDECIARNEKCFPQFERDN